MTLKASWRHLIIRTPVLWNEWKSLPYIRMHIDKAQSELRVIEVSKTNQQTSSGKCHVLGTRDIAHRRVPLDTPSAPPDRSAWKSTWGPETESVCGREATLPRGQHQDPLCKGRRPGPRSPQDTEASSAPEHGTEEVRAGQARVLSAESLAATPRSDPSPAKEPPADHPRRHFAFFPGQLILRHHQCDARRMRWPCRASSRGGCWQWGLFLPRPLSTCKPFAPTQGTCRRHPRSYESWSLGARNCVRVNGVGWQEAIAETGQGTLHTTVHVLNVTAAQGQAPAQGGARGVPPPQAGAGPLAVEKSRHK